MDRIRNLDFGMERLVMFRKNASRRLIILFGLIVSTAPFRAFAEINPEEVAKQVTIHRDQWGVPHVDAPTDAACVFGIAYAQAEDYFWQIEDTYLQSIGRYAEAVGVRGVKSDVLCLSFEIPRRSQAEFASMSEETKLACEHYAAGLNYFLTKHPEVTPRLITSFEPWMVLAWGRYTMLYWVFERTGAKNADLSALHNGGPPAGQNGSPADDTGQGSNLWAIGPSRTKNGSAMLFTNPHQPWFGIGQWWEAHVRSGEGWNFTGSSFFGGPFPNMGHNEHIGWTHTANKPDLGDLYRVVFDDPANPLNYKYDGGYKTAEAWTETLKVKKSVGEGFEERVLNLRKTHHGPIVAKENDTTFLAAKLANLFEVDQILQAKRMTKAKNLAEFMEAVNMGGLLMFNIGYADREGNIMYAYQGAIPVRDPKFDYTHAVDGSDPNTEWKGMHKIEEMPLSINPLSGFVQNCNQSPFTTTDEGGPYVREIPPYMVQEKFPDNRRAEVSRRHLRAMKDVTFEQWQELVTDTEMLWPKTEMPEYKRMFEQVQKTNPVLAAKVYPYLHHLLEWDYINTKDCTQSTLCFEWYEIMFGRGYPSEVMKPEYIYNHEKRFEALVEAAENLKQLWGDWKVPYGNVFRIQRHANVTDVITAPFKDNLPSVPCLGASGAMGISYNVYYSPSTRLRKQRFGVVGGSFMAVYEFTKDRINSKTLLQFGQSADPNSPHFDDQAKLYSEKKWKDGWFYWDEVEANTVRKYKPGE